MSSHGSGEGRRLGAKVSVLAMAMALLGSCATDSSVEPGWLVPADFHAERLSAGDWRVETISRSGLGTEPYHWRRLVDLGEQSLPVLVEMLADDTPTPFLWWSGEVWFSGGVVVIDRRAPPPEKRRATVAELGDKALQAICKTNGVGFSSSLPAHERALAVQRWREIVDGLLADTPAVEVVRPQGGYREAGRQVLGSE